MAKNQLNVRLEDDLMTALDETANNSGRTKTSIVSAALASYLNVDSNQLSIESLSERVNALESKIENMLQEPRTESTHNLAEKKLITIEQAAELTGYAVSSLRSSLSKNDIKAKDRKGKKGLYSKAEILERIGTQFG